MQLEEILTGISLVSAVMSTGAALFSIYSFCQINQSRRRMETYLDERYPESPRADGNYEI